MTSDQVELIEQLIDAKQQLHSFQTFVAGEDTYGAQLNVQRLMELVNCVEALKARLLKV